MFTFALMWCVFRAVWTEIRFEWLFYMVPDQIYIWFMAKRHEWERSDQNIDVLGPRFLTEWIKKSVFLKCDLMFRAMQLCWLTVKVGSQSSEWCEMMIYMHPSVEKTWMSLLLSIKKAAKCYELHCSFHLRKVICVISVRYINECLFVNCCKAGTSIFHNSHKCKKCCFIF